MITQARLGLRLQRFEVLAVVVATLIVGLSALIVRSRLDAVGVSADCWAAWLPSGGPTTIDRCDEMVNAFIAIDEGEAFLVMAAMAILPLMAGLFLGLPVVAREVEGGTAPTIWALAGSRRRWLAGRLLPLLGVLVLTLGFLAFASDVLWAGRQPWLPLPRFEDVGLHGPGLIGRGLAAMGLVLLAGTVVGRVLPAVIVGLVLCLVLTAGWAFSLSAWADTVAESHPKDSLTPTPAGSYWASQGWLTSDGRLIVDYQEALALAPPDVDPHEWLQNSGAEATGVLWLDRTVPPSAYPTWSLIETVALGGLGILGLALAFPIVDRRRP